MSPPSGNDLVECAVTMLLVAAGVAWLYVTLKLIALAVGD